MRMRVLRIPFAVVVVVVSAAIGGVCGSRLTASEDRAVTRYRMYAAALDAVERDYVVPLDSPQIVYGSIDGMLRTLDPHSSFFDPKQFANMREREQGHYYGIGVSIVASIEGDITVTQLFEGSPAYQAGIRRGDVIAMVEKESTKGWTTDEVVKHIKGPKGTTVNISIRRPGVQNLIPVTVARDEINIVTVRTAFMIAPGTGYIRLQDFSETTDQEMTAALKKLADAGMQRVILDLRENPGGPIDAAIATANKFLKRGQMIVYTRGRVPNSDIDSRATEEGAYPTVPLVVLVNRDSASASEIVTGAMQDHDRGLIVGETTFGKALVQSVYPISGGAGLALTTAHYYTPSGRVIQRPWDASFDDYMTYQLRDQNGSRPHPASELHHTDAGRSVYGGGGIEPDHFIPGPIEGFTPSRFLRAVYTRGAFVSFAEHFTREGDTRPGAAAAAASHRVAKGWQVSDALVAEFKQDLVNQRVRLDDAAFAADVPFIKAMIRYEVDVDLFGVEEARRNLTAVDPQVQSALGYFDEAKHLLELPKKGT
jgi:carboxyl-terminal processing protease